MYTARVNIRAQEERQRKEKELKLRDKLSKIEAAAGPAAKPRKRKGLNFHEPGTFVAQAEQLRKKAKLEALQKRIAAAAAKTGITDAVKLASLTTKAVAEKKPDEAAPKIVIQEEDIPEIEWWDKPLLRDRSLGEVILRLEIAVDRPEDIFNGITRLVEHPPIKKPPGPDNSAVQIPIFLTEKERKKLKRQNKKNAELEKQEQIKLGLLPKPEPKLKQSNIMHALGDEAIINPSLAEQKVRDQEEKRKEAHIEHNESKKLTKKERAEKKLRKIQEDVSVTGLWISVFRVLNINKFLEWKVKLNAKQFHMTGVLNLYKDINLVIVEGGPKQNRQFKHLMMDRIRWREQPTNDKVCQDDLTKNKCLLVWEGQTQQRAFKDFSVKHMESESQAREFFKRAGVENYWDLAFKMSILESIEES